MDDLLKNDITEIIQPRVQDDQLQDAPLLNLCFMPIQYVCHSVWQFIFIMKDPIVQGRYLNLKKISNIDDLAYNFL